MSKICFSLFLCVTLLSVGGCAGLKDFPKKIWGSSTADLERGRETALQKTYHCSVTECFDAVLALTVLPKEPEPLTPQEQKAADLAKATEPQSSQPPAYRPNPSATDPSLPIMPPSTTYLQPFIKDRHRNLIVVMGVPNCVNTTEVGIFFTPQETGNVKVELSSLSTKAKRNAAKIIFAHLGKNFPEIQ